MSFTQLLKERDAIPCTPIFPIANNGTQFIGTIDMSKFNRAQFFILLGTLGAGGSIQAYLQETVNSNGASPTNIASGAITNLATASCMATLEISAMQMTKRYLLCNTAVNVIQSTYAGIGIGTEGRYPPVNNNDSVSVAQRLAI